jgi:hypothetical protein
MATLPAAATCGLIRFMTLAASGSARVPGMGPRSQLLFDDRARRFAMTIGTDASRLGERSQEKPRQQDRSEQLLTHSMQAIFQPAIH